MERNEGRFGKMEAHVAIQKDKINVFFSAPTDRMCMTPHEATGLANAILEAVNRLTGPQIIMRRPIRPEDFE